MSARQPFRQGFAESLGGVVMRHQDQATGEIRRSRTFVLEKDFGGGDQ
jgi:hypothetical protein